VKRTEWRVSRGKKRTQGKDKKEEVKGPRVLVKRLKRSTMSFSDDM
jgi:hypothetical protein